MNKYLLLSCISAFSSLILGYFSGVILLTNYRESRSRKQLIYGFLAIVSGGIGGAFLLILVAQGLLW